MNKGINLFAFYKRSKFTTIYLQIYNDFLLFPIFSDEIWDVLLWNDKKELI